MIRIAIVDDHPVVRAGLREFLSEQSGLFVAAEADSGAAVADIVRTTALDIVILDLAMPRKSGLEVLTSIRAREPGVRVLVLSSYPAELYEGIAMRLGASAYLSKSCEPEQIVSTIRTLCAPEAATVARAPSADSVDESDRDAPHDRLTRRELQILLRLAAGETTTAVGVALSLSPGTVSAYRGSLTSKLGLTTNAELTRYVLTRGLL